MKALAPQPRDRYPTALALAEEIEHWLADEPVSAIRETVSRRIGRWARRHRAWVQAAVAALLAISMVAITATFQINRALGREKQARAGETRARTEAEENFQAARQAVDDSFTLISEEILFDEPGLQPVRRKLLQRALEYHQHFVRERGGDKALKSELARSELRLANIIALLGRHEESLKYYLTCRTRYEELVRDQPDDLASRKGLVECLINSARIQKNLSKFAESGEILGVALRHLEPVTDVDLEASQARALFTHGELAFETGKIAEARQFKGRAVAILEGLVKRHPDTLRFKADLSSYYVNHSKDIIALGRRAEAIRMCERACGIEESFLRANPESVLHRYNLVMARFGIGWQQMLSEHWVESAAAFDGRAP